MARGERETTHQYETRASRTDVTARGETCFYFPCGNCTTDRAEVVCSSRKPDNPKSLVPGLHNTLFRHLKVTLRCAIVAPRQRCR